MCARVSFTLISHSLTLTSTDICNGGRRSRSGTRLDKTSAVENITLCYVTHRSIRFDSIRFESASETFRTRAYTHTHTHTHFYIYIHTHTLSCHCIRTSWTTSNLDCASMDGSLPEQSLVCSLGFLSLSADPSVWRAIAAMCCAVSRLGQPRAWMRKERQTNTARSSHELHASMPYIELGRPQGHPGRSMAFNQSIDHPFRPSYRTCVCVCLSSVRCPLLASSHR